MKHRKWQKGRRKGMGIDARGTEVAFGAFGLKALEAKWITSGQIEAVKKVVARSLKKKGRMWLRIFPQKPRTGKGGEVGMGGGKGAVTHYVFPVKPGRVLFELDGIDEKTARNVFAKVTPKLPIKTIFIKRV